MSLQKDDEELDGLCSVFFGEESMETSEYCYGPIRLRLKSQDTSNQHVQPSTGLLAWPAAHELANYILENRAMFEDKNVLELGSGIGISGFVSAHISRKTVLSDLDEKVLELLQSNRILNFSEKSDKVFVERLEWGNEAELSHVIQKHGKFDVLIGSDLVYRIESVRPLFDTISMFLKMCPGAKCILALVGKDIVFCLFFYYYYYHCYFSIRCKARGHAFLGGHNLISFVFARKHFCARKLGLR
eukprot:TRINITY_DN263_c0_g3_i1.p1 TRINITY_DN263_c0_g3~~TRINITY_DN263_c0_g3_i1.p1  ORF type:complete len:244 (+),score=20.71 TRINITY_DN263_c0_g3_i1:50-781(+)